MALQAVGAAWMVEQPISSLAWYHPRLRAILRYFTKVCYVWLVHPCCEQWAPFRFGYDIMVNPLTLMITRKTK